MGYQNNNKILDSTEWQLESFELKLYKIYSDLQLQYGCGYMFFSYEDLSSKQRVVFQTDPDWKRTYIEEDLVKNCPIVNRGEEILGARMDKNVLLQWDMCKHKNTKERQVIDARKDHEIFYGLSIVIDHNSIRKNIGIATHESNKNFIRNVLNDSEKFKSCFSLASFYADPILQSKISKQIDLK